MGLLYNDVTMMKHSNFTVPTGPRRKHRALFDNDLPFRGRRERSRTEYQRRAKHRSRDHDAVA